MTRLLLLASTFLLLLYAGDIVAFASSDVDADHGVVTGDRDAVVTPTLLATSTDVEVAEEGLRLEPSIPTPTMDRPSPAAQVAAIGLVPVAGMP